MDSLTEAKELLSGCLFIPVEKIPDDVGIQSIGELDSLSFEAVILELEERVGRHVDPLDLLDLHTVRDLAKLIERYR